FARLIGDDRAVGNQGRQIFLRAGDADPSELTGSQKEIRIWELGSHPDRAGAAIDLVVDEIEHTLALPVRLVGEADLNDRRAVARLAELAGFGGAFIGEMIALAHI